MCLGHPGVNLSRGAQEGKEGEAGSSKRGGTDCTPRCFGGWETHLGPRSDNFIKRSALLVCKEHLREG